MFLDNFKNRIIHRGLDYFYNDNVKEVKRIDYDVISGVVEGSEEYEVTIDKDVMDKARVALDKMLELSK